ncbi:uncharacterized protein YciI [Pseudomonas sp. SJZ080]|uniref:YciI family protein n=1 Tax=Pseudomonas sp. SJZ080 TaxID=2572888 RepID=UPI00119C0B49|nr:YciI family protein [Pseudomonas sp. SJZ080]TWC43891.1 uncharacterized protein YciI [Pseudomonas sp. SJZ080]
MYIVDLTYLKTIDVIEVYLESHRQFLDEQYTQELFLASGPKNPRNGGVIIVSGRVSRSELDAILAKDPFHQNGIAAYGVTEFVPVKSHPALSGIL